MQLESGQLLQRLKPLFQENFEKLGELGAAVSVWQNARPIIDFCGGFRDTDRANPWTSRLQRRKVRNSRSTKLGRSTPSVREAASARSVSRGGINHSESPKNGGLDDRVAKGESRRRLPSRPSLSQGVRGAPCPQLFHPT